MINNVNLNSYSKNFSSEFSKPKTGYMMMSKKEVKAERDNAKEEKSHALAKSITASAIVLGFGSMLLLKGSLPKNVSNKLNKFKLNLEQKVANFNEGKTVNKFEELYITGLKGVSSFLSKSDRLNNFTSVKDTIFQRMMWGEKDRFGKAPFTKKIHTSITKMFENIGSSTVSNSYSSTNTKFFNFNRRIETINTELLANPSKVIEINGVCKTAKEWLADATVIRKSVNNDLAKGFGQEARAARYGKMQENLAGLYDYTNEKLYSKELLHDFVAETYIKPSKMKMGNDVSTLRQLITHNIMDNYNATIKALANIDDFISPADKSTREIVRQLRNHLDDYKKLSGNDEVVRRNSLNCQIVEKLSTLSKAYSGNAEKFKYSATQVEDVSVYIKEVQSIIGENKKGPIQELLTIYKGLLPRNEYLKLRDYADGAVKSLDKSIDKETVQFYDKCRDLTLGSAPTDVLSIAATLGGVGYGLTKADDNEERISLMFKAGIPAVATVATPLVCSAGLISGGKSMALGILSGVVMNKVGNYVDDFRKKVKDKKLNMNLDLNLNNLVNADSEKTISA
ncbi:MAG: hypothetical protein R3Y28_04715 [Candidatus Gastranaerophilales bacterium]